MLQRIVQRLFVITFYLLAAMKNVCAESLDSEQIRALIAETRAQAAAEKAKAWLFAC
jgi:hypothetical protein